eukprot:gene23238-35611_t
MALTSDELLKCVEVYEQAGEMDNLWAIHGALARFGWTFCPSDFMGTDEQAENLRRTFDLCGFHPGETLSYASFVNLVSIIKQKFAQEERNRKWLHATAEKPGNSADPDRLSCSQVSSNEMPTPDLAVCGLSNALDLFNSLSPVDGVQYAESTEATPPLGPADFPTPPEPTPYPASPPSAARDAPTPAKLRPGGTSPPPGAGEGSPRLTVSGADGRAGAAADAKKQLSRAMRALIAQQRVAAAAAADGGGDLAADFDHTQSTHYNASASPAVSPRPASGLPSNPEAPPALFMSPNPRAAALVEASYPSFRKLQPHHAAADDGSLLGGRRADANEDSFYDAGTSRNLLDAGHPNPLMNTRGTTHSASFQGSFYSANGATQSAPNIAALFVSSLMRSSNAPEDGSMPGASRSSRWPGLLSSPTNHKALLSNSTSGRFAAPTTESSQLRLNSIMQKAAFQRQITNKRLKAAAAAHTGRPSLWEHSDPTQPTVKDARKRAKKQRQHRQRQARARSAKPAPDNDAPAETTPPEAAEPRPAKEKPPQQKDPQPPVHGRPPASARAATARPRPNPPPGGAAPPPPPFANSSNMASRLARSYVQAVLSQKPRRGYSSSSAKHTDTPVATDTEAEDQPAQPARSRPQKRPGLHRAGSPYAQRQGGYVHSSSPTRFVRKEQEQHKIAVAVGLPREAHPAPGEDARAQRRAGYAARQAGGRRPLETGAALAQLGLPAKLPDATMDDAVLVARHVRDAHFQKTAGHPSRLSTSPARGYVSPLSQRYPRRRASPRNHTKGVVADVKTRKLQLQEQQRQQPPQHPPSPPEPRAPQEKEEAVVPSPSSSSSATQGLSDGSSKHNSPPAGKKAVAPAPAKAAQMEKWAASHDYGSRGVSSSFRSVAASLDS